MAAELRGKVLLSDLAERIVENYRQLPIIEHLDQSPLPSSQPVVEIVQDLKDLVFPGYAQRRRVHWSNVAERVGELVESLHARLSEQIARSLRYEDSDHRLHVAVESHPDELDADSDCRAREKALRFLQSLPRIRHLIAIDVQAAFDGDPAARSPDEIIFCYPGLEAVTVYRLAHELHVLGVPLIPRMMGEWAHGRTGIDIHPGARIGPGFFIDHGTGVVIGETCEIADHVKLYQGVTLGALSFQQDSDGNLVRGTKRHPTIERKVVVYANATVLGGTTVVGANSVIGAGASITKSVPPNTVVTVEKPSLRFREAS